MVDFVHLSNGGLKARLKKPVYNPKCQVLNGPPSQVTLPFEYWTPIVNGIWKPGIQKVNVFDNYKNMVHGCTKRALHCQHLKKEQLSYLQKEYCRYP